MNNNEIWDKFIFPLMLHYSFKLNTPVKNNYLRLMLKYHEIHVSADPFFLYLIVQFYFHYCNWVTFHICTQYHTIFNNTIPLLFSPFQLILSKGCKPSLTIFYMGSKRYVIAWGDTLCTDWCLAHKTQLICHLDVETWSQKNFLVSSCP